MARTDLKKNYEPAYRFQRKVQKYPGYADSRHKHVEAITSALEVTGWTESDVFHNHLNKGTTTELEMEYYAFERMKVILY